MSEMVERVAKAAGDVFTAEHDAIVEYMLSDEFALRGSSGATTAMVDAMLVKIARAAIEAMREPTEAMLQAGQGSLASHLAVPLAEVTASSIRELHEALVDAALSPSNQEET